MMTFQPGCLRDSRADRRGVGAVTPDPTYKPSAPRRLTIIPPIRNDGVRPRSARLERISNITHVSRSPAPLRNPSAAEALM